LSISPLFSFIPFAKLPLFFSLRHEAAERGGMSEKKVEVKRGERREKFFFLLSFLFVPQKEEIEHKQINISEMFTYQFLPSLLFSPTPTGCSKPSPSCRRSLTPIWASKCNTC
jgi:hypothetical protein